MKKANEILDDSIKSTLFGKFYENILLGWVKEIEGFIPFAGKPRIYWGDVKFTTVDIEGGKKLNGVLKKYKDEKQFCTPDGLLQKGGKFYVWEAKNWPLWTEGKKPLDQLRDLLYTMPQILSTKAVFRKKEYILNGVLFSWWSKPEGVETLSREIRRLIAPRTFEIFYTADVLEECIQNKYWWYRQIIKEEKTRIDELFEDLLGL
jgi:hypothetical protein